VNEKYLHTYRRDNIFFIDVILLRDSREKIKGFNQYLEAPNKGVIFQGNLG